MPVKHQGTSDPRLVERNVEDLEARLGGTVRGDSVTLEFPGGSPNATGEVIEHGLGSLPKSLQVTAIAASAPLDFFVVGGSETSRTFTIGARTQDGSSPVLGASQGCYWLAYG